MLAFEYPGSAYCDRDVLKRSERTLSLKPCAAERQDTLQLHGKRLCTWGHLTAQSQILMMQRMSVVRPVPFMNFVIFVQQFPFVGVQLAVSGQII